MSAPHSSANLALRLRAQAAARPGAIALIDAARTDAAHTEAPRTSYAELEARSDALAHALEQRGLRTGERALVLLRSGPDLCSTAWALFKLGAVPVFIDPGMGLRGALACIRRAAPRALIAEAEAHWLRALCRGAFASVEIALVGGRRLPARGERLEHLGARATRAYEPVPRAPQDEAAILFTSGSTGPAKGVRATHGMLGAQADALQAHFGLRAGEIDLACFPLFALFDQALGLTSVFPRVDPSRPGRSDPAEVHAALVSHGADTAFASPAIWRKLAPWARARGATLGCLKRVLIAGAPVPSALVAELHALMEPGGEVHTPYGATEALPLCSIRGSEILELRTRAESGEGTCVGRALPGVELALIRVSDEPIPRWSDTLRVAAGEAGEVCARGAVVSTAYAFEAEANVHAKIEAAEPQGARWHRMGDLGRFDADGRLWFLGRKRERIESALGVLHPVPIENVFAAHPRVARAALVGAGERGAEQAVLLVEVEGRPPRGAARRELEREILAFGAARLPAVPVAAVALHAGFPVDARHNAKIRRDELRGAARAALGRR